MLYVALIILLGLLANRVGITILNLIPDCLVRWRWIASSDDGRAVAFRMIPFVMFIVGGWNLLALAGYDLLKDGGIGVF